MRPTFAITGPLGILAAYTCASALAAPLPPDEAVLACPQTAAQWSDWRQNLVSGLNAPEDLIDGRARAILECQSQPEQKAFFRDPGFAACMAPVQEALTAVKAIRDTDINDTGNFALLFKPALSHLGPDDNPEVEELPAFFLKPDFLKACVTKDLSNAAVRSIMRQLAAEHPGAETVQFKSRFGIGDESIVSRIPDRRYDRWIHLHRSSEGLTHFVIMLSIEKRTAPGSASIRPGFFSVLLRSTPASFSLARALRPLFPPSRRTATTG